jgi:hypothetical protein
MKTEEQVAAFLERMGKRTSESGASHSGMHRVAFAAVQPLVEGVLARGYTMKATWDALREEKKLSMSYETFRTHCRRAGIARSGATSLPEEAVRGFCHGRVRRRGDINW